jgi:hypothetical protein
MGLFTLLIVLESYKDSPPMVAHWPWIRAPPIHVPHCLTVVGRKLERHTVGSLAQLWPELEACMLVTDEDAAYSETVVLGVER